VGYSPASLAANMIHGALCIKDAMALSRVHFHGLLGDLIVIDDAPGVDVDRTRLALLRARQLASMKAANDSGEIKSADDLFDVVPVVQGRCLAAVERFADAVSSRYHLDADGRAHVAAEWHYFDQASKQHLFFVPSRGIHERSGGTVSLGDTIDIAALVFSRTETKPKLPPRLQGMLNAGAFTPRIGRLGMPVQHVPASWSFVSGPDPGAGCSGIPGP
jgi:ADP-dependent phosphofructokinase/glucokinase